MTNKGKNEIKTYVWFEDNDTVTFSMTLSEVERVFHVTPDKLKSMIVENKVSELKPIVDFFGQHLLAYVEMAFGRNYVDYSYTIHCQIKEDMFMVNFGHDGQLRSGDYDYDFDDDDEDDDYDECPFTFIEEDEDETWTLDIGPLAAVVCHSFSELSQVCKILTICGVQKADLLKNVAGEYVLYIKDDLSDEARSRLLNIINGEYGFSCYTVDEDIEKVLAIAREHKDILMEDVSIDVLI